MNIHIPRYIAYPLIAAIVGGLLALAIKETPDMIRYAKIEGM